MNPGSIKHLSTSSLLIHAVSNRLAASVPRARFLGMIVGMTVSKLVDQPARAMNFPLEADEVEEARLWTGLTEVQDAVGDINVLRTPLDLVNKSRGPSVNLRTGKTKAKPVPKSASPSSKIIAIEEIDEVSEEEDDLVPYSKPDDDPSDSDDDPTLIDRLKPSQPVYIVDLIRYLNTNDKPDVIELALRTAPSLVRRKATFGTELSDNVQSLTSTLINLQESLSEPANQQLRLQSLIACLVSQPRTIGPYLTSLYFSGDFSLSQYATLLTTIGLSARELAGHKDDSSISPPTPTFPSKELPAHLSTLYHPLITLSSNITTSTLQPLALAAADKLSGPDILKIRTFSSRMAVESRTRAVAASRSRTIPRDLHLLLTNAFYLPLCCRMSLLLSSPTTSTNNQIFTPHILHLFISTLTILLSTIGPHALSLSTLTRETLLLLLSLHNHSHLCLDPVVLPSVLQLLLTTLDLNIEAGAVAEERLVSDHGTSVAELVAWAAGLGNVVAVPVTEEKGQGMPWPVLVAGIQVKWHEVGRKFQGRMLGLTVGEMEGLG